MTSPWDEPAPGEHEAGERVWQVVRSAYVQREPLPGSGRRRPELRPALVLVAAAVAAAALGTAGAAVFEAIRGGSDARRAFTSLPGGGRLLLESSSGSWVVRADGSKRRLGPYADPTWSPRGLYVAAARGHELLALEPDGDVRWSLARRGRIRLPSWKAPDGYRIAYLAGPQLRVVAGDGTGDRAFAGYVPAVRPAWRPGSANVLAFADGRGIRVVATDGRRLLWRQPLPATPTHLEWSDDGRRLLVVSPLAVRVFDGRGRVVAQDDPSDGSRAVTAAFLPGRHLVAEIRSHGTQSDVFVLGTGRILFRGAGTLSELAWSPDGRWLVVAWPSADQLLFIRSTAVNKVVAFSGVSATFGGFPRVAGWSR